MPLRILNNKEKKAFVEALERDYKARLDELRRLEILQGSQEYYAVNRQCLEQDLGGLNLDSVGLRVAVESNGSIKPTVHALQAFFNDADKKIEVSRPQAGEFISRKEVKVEAQDGTHIISCENKALDIGEVKDSILLRRR